MFNLKNKDREKGKKIEYLLRDHAWFICYAPAEKPVIAVAVLIEHGEHGAGSAAPIAKEIVLSFLREKGIIDKTGKVKQDRDRSKLLSP